MSDAEYGDGFVAAGRRNENGLDVALDADGNVIGGRLLGRDDESEEFWKTALRTRDLYPIDPADIDLHGAPVDEDGRGLTVLEVEQQHLTIHPEDQAA